MFDILKSIYGQAFTYYDETIDNPDDYYWFESHNNVQFGIRRSAVTERELQLLSIQFSAANQLLKPQNLEQQAWSSLLFSDEISHEHQSLLFFPCYPLHVHFKSLPNDISSFNEAMGALFSSPPIILWKDNQATLLLKQADDLSFANEIVDLMASDLFVDVTVMTGAVLGDRTLAHKSFNIQRELFSFAQQFYPHKRVIKLDYLIPLYFVKNTSTTFVDILLDNVNQALIDGGAELQETLTTFLHNNMNVSTASKALYIHRNSLQYRLDKFTEKTHLDPKTFEDAVVIYMGLLKHKLDNLVTFSQEEE